MSNTNVSKPKQTYTFDIWEIKEISKMLLKTPNIDIKLYIQSMESFECPIVSNRMQALF